MELCFFNPLHYGNTDKPLCQIVVLAFSLRITVSGFIANFHLLESEVNGIGNLSTAFLWGIHGDNFCRA